MMMEQGENAITLAFNKRWAGSYEITDDEGTIVFKVKPFNTAYHRQLVLIGADNNIKLLLRREFFTGRWNAYRGISTDTSDILFSIRSKTRSNKQKGALKIKWLGRTFQMNGEDVYMLTARPKVASANLFEKKKRMQDVYTVTAHPNVHSARIYKGGLLTAQMKRMESMEDIKQKFAVTVNPCVDLDLAYVISVFAIIEARSGYTYLDKSHHHNQHLGDVPQAFGPTSLWITVGGVSKRLVGVADDVPGPAERVVEVVEGVPERIIESVSEVAEGVEGELIEVAETVSEVSEVAEGGLIEVTEGVSQVTQGL